MKVLVPHQKDQNIYLDEIIKYSESEFVFGNFKDFNSSFDIVNIQFPEAIFDWKVPTQTELNELESQIRIWKMSSKIVYTMNDFKKHYDKKENFDNLFSLIHKNADAVIHLGNYSMQHCQKMFSEDCIHTIIHHPLYSSLLESGKRENIEEIYKIDLENKFVVSVIGGIRSKEEMKLIFKIFKKIPVKNKFLVVPRMFQFLEIPDYIPYRFRKKYRKLMESLYCLSLSKKQYYFNSLFLDYSYLINLVDRSSVIIIPRVRNLNSGNLFLGLTFDKPMVIPGIGNLTEEADNFGLPVFDIINNSYEDVINKVLELEHNSYFQTKQFQDKKKEYQPEKIAMKYDSFFKSLIF
ncbi:hypothetical protein [Flavobacterium daejeonense]|uniref:hypothetical protein n=1 Tax=Flavobacterium daejeonense TaxID=350893 RepID=UPI00047E8421|nr:hypothetical protein [Flavobacterium daejeonense]